MTISPPRIRSFVLFAGDSEGPDLRFGNDGSVVKTRSGRVSRAGQDRCVLQFTPDHPESVKALADRLPASVDALASLWTARPTAHENVHIETELGRWCEYGVHGTPKPPTSSSFFPARA